MFPGLGLSTVVPAELGTTNDPRALIPGNPDAVLAKLATLTKLSAGIDEASSAFTKIDAEQWQGAAGDSFRQAFSREVPHWHDSATAFDAARTALQDYGHALQAAQNQAAEAIEMFNRAMRATQAAQAQYDAAAQQHAAAGATMAPMAPFSDPGAADREEAQAKLDDARKAVRDAGDNAAHTIGIQRDSAPEGPGPLERVWATLTDTGASFANAEWHAVTGAMGAVVDMAKPLIALGPLATLTHPMTAVTNVANLGTGLLHAANHPVEVGKSLVDFDEWGKDPAAAVGKTGVNIGSLLVGGEGAAAKGAEGANLARGAGTAEKTTTTATNAGETIEQAAHTLLKPADPAAHAPTPGSHEYAGNADFHASAADHQAFRDHVGDGAFDSKVLEELHRNMHQFHPDVAKMPDEELVGMKHYTGIHHMDINQALRDGDPAALHHFDPEIKNAASGMNRLPDWQGTSQHPVVYRGIAVDPGHLPDLLSRYGEHEMVTEPGFTSGDKENGYPGNVQFVIEPHYGKDLEFLNPYGGMREVCWPPGNSFEVLSRKFDEANGQWRIYLKDHGR